MCVMCEELKMEVMKRRVEARGIVLRWGPWGGMAKCKNEKRVCVTTCHTHTSENPKIKDVRGTPNLHGQSDTYLILIFIRF